MKISVMLLTHNRRGVTFRCLYGLDSVMVYSNVEVLILDNASTDGTASWLAKVKKRFPALRLYLSSENLGVLGGRQFLLDRARGKYLIFLDSDVVIQNRYWFDPIIDALNRPEVGLAGPGGHMIPSHWHPQPVDLEYQGPVDVISGYC